MDTEYEYQEAMQGMPHIPDPTEKQLAEMEQAFGQSRNQVNIDGVWIDAEAVEFVGISEGMQGEDRLTFVWQGKEYTRTVYKKN